MEDKDKILDYTKPVRLPDDCSKIRKNFTQGFFHREIGRYKNAVPSEFQWAAEDKLINKILFEELKCELPDSPRSTFLMVFSPDGKKVASTHGNHNVYVTDLTTGKNIQTLSGHPRTPWCIAFHPSSNQILASGCLGGQVRVWDLHGGSEVWTAESQTVIASLAFHPVDRMLVIATYNELHFWDWSQPEPFAKCSTKSEREKVRYVSFDRLGNKLITGIANPVNMPSQWDRVSVVNSQPPVTSTTSTTTTAISSAPPTTVTNSQPSSEQGRCITFCYCTLMNQYNQLVNRYFDLSRSQIIPTIDRGTDPMDLLDLRSNGTSSESSTSNPSPSTSNSQANSSSPLRFKITRSACRSYRRLNSRERFRIQSNAFSRLSSRPSLSCTLAATTASTSVNQNSVFSTPVSGTSSSSLPPRVRRCAFSFPTARSWCLTLSPENSTNLFSTRNSSLSTTSTRAVTNPTYTSFSERGIFSTRETSSNNSDRSQFSVIRPYRLLLEGDDFRTASQQTAQPDSELTSSNHNHSESRPNFSSSEEQEGILRTSRQDSDLSASERLRSVSRDTSINTSDDLEIDTEFQRSNSITNSRQQELESGNSTQLNSGFSPATEFTRRPSSRFQLAPVDLRNVSPVRRFREDPNSEGLCGSSFRRENRSLSQSLMHPRPIPRFQVRSRLVQYQQSQLRLITNRETHGLNLQNNQSLRRQLSFRPGGQFVLSRHSNSPFQPRVPHHIESSTQVNSPTNLKNNGKGPRPEIPSLRSSFTSSVSSNTDLSEGNSSTSFSSGNSFSGNSIPSNLSFTGDGSFRQLPEQINRRLFDRVKMMLRDRIQNSSENASADSTVNYSRISGESEAEARNSVDTSLESAELPRGLGPRGVDPMLSSASESLDASNDAFFISNAGNSSPTSSNPNGVSSNANDTNTAQSDLLDPWDSETDTVPFSWNELLSEEPTEEFSAQQVGANLEQIPSTSNNSSDHSNSPSPELSATQGVELLSLHIENMQRLCWARIEILQLQKIRGMWEDLTNQIRHFHNTIQNRTAEQSSTVSSSPVQNENSNSGGEIPSFRGLAISSSPVQESSSPSTSSERSSEAAIINGYKKLVESMVNDLFNESKRQNPPKKSSKATFQNSKNPSGCPSSSGNSNGSKSSSSSAARSSRNETEEPQAGPSGLSTSSNSRGIANTILRNENLKFRVYKHLLDTIQRTRRRREPGTSSGLQRQNAFRIRNSSRPRFHCHRPSRHSLDSSNPRSRIASRELESILETFWKNENATSKPSQPVPSTSSSDLNQPSTSARRNSSSSDACQSCGQKKRPNKELGKQKRRSADSFGGSGSSSSASKVLKNNVGERSDAPNREGSVDGGGEGTSNQDCSSSSQTQENSTNELLKQMIKTMETMLRFQREAFRRTERLMEGNSMEPQPLSLPSFGDDSDSDQNDANEQSRLFMRNFPRNFRCIKEVIVNLIRDITQLRAKKLLGFMVKSLTQFFGKNFSNLNQVLGEQISSLYMLLQLALELTDLLLDQLNARSRDLKRPWALDNSGEVGSAESRGRNWLLTRQSSAAGRMRERSRNFGRSSYNPPYGASRDDSLRYRIPVSPSLRSHSRLTSRLNSSGSVNSNHDRSSMSSSYCRRKRRTARMSTSLPFGWYSRSSRLSSQSNIAGSSAVPSRTINGNSLGSRYRSFRFDRRSRGDEQLGRGIRAFDYEINNNSSNNDTNNNYSLNDDRNNNSNTNNSNNNNNNSSNNINSSRTSNSSDISNDNSNIHNSFLNYYFPNNSSSNNSDSGNNNIIILTGLSNNSDISTSSSGNIHSGNRNNSNEGNTSGQSGSNTSFLSQNPLPSLRTMELTLTRNDSRDLSLRDERPIFWIRYGGNNETTGLANSSDSQSRVSNFTVPVVQVNDVPVSDVSMLNQPRHRPQSPVPRVPEDIWRWRTWRPRFLHPRYSGPNPFDDQDSNDVPENIHYYRILSTSPGSHLGVYTLDPMIITDAPLSPHHRIQAWDFSKMNIPDISDREANGVVPECKIHNDASVDVSNDGHLLVTLLPSGRLSVTTMLGVYSLDWSSLGQLLYRTSFEQNAVSVSLSPTNRHLLVGLASRPVVVRDRANMAQIFRLEGGRPSPHGGSWQSGRGRLVHIRDVEQTRGTNIMSLNCIRWAPGAGQGLVYGTNTGQLKVLR